MRKAQVWISDMTISILLFSVAAVIAFGIIINSFQEKTNFYEIKQDSGKISEYILSEGTPLDWNESTVIRPGVLTGNRINSTKVELAMSITNSSYAQMKSNLQTNQDFLIVFEEKNKTIIPFGPYCAIGKAGIIEINLTAPVSCTQADFSYESFDNLAKVNRYAVYDSRIVRVVIYVWD